MVRDIKLYQANPHRTNLAISVTESYARKKLMFTTGLTWHGPYQKQWKEEPEWYRHYHYRMSDLMASRLSEPILATDGNTVEYEDQFREQIYSYVMDNPVAVSWYNKSVDLLHTIKCVKAMDMRIIKAIIADFGLNPDEFKRTLRPWQLQSLALYILLGYSDNWGQQRTGKTPPTIIYNTALYLKREIELCLVVVPASITWGWWDELELDLDTVYQTLSHVVEGPKTKRVALLKRPSIFKIIGYDSFRCTVDEIQETLDGVSYSIVLDESQYVKNQSLRTAAVKLLFDSDNPPKYACFLSGTAVANTPIDVHRPVNLTAPSLLCRDEDDFKAVYTTDWGGKLEYKQGAIEEISNRMSRCSVRATRAKCDLEIGLVIDPQVVIMSERQTKIYRDIQTVLRTQVLAESGELVGIKVSSMLARIQKLIQVTDGFLYDADSKPIWLPEKDNPKLRWLDGYVDDYLYDIEKLVVYSRFTAVLQMLEGRYKQHGVVRVDGTVTNAHTRNDLVKQFVNEAETRIILMNTRVAKGQDLNPAQFIIPYDRLFWLEPNEQADTRITGMRQQAEGTIMPLVCVYPDQKNQKEATIDEALVYDILPKKREMAATVYGDDEKDTLQLKSTAITKADILKLVGL